MDNEKVKISVVKNTITPKHGGQIIIYKLEHNIQVTVVLTLSGRLLSVDTKVVPNNKPN